MTEKEKILVCLDCVKDKRYKLLIKKNNTNGICTCCGNQHYVIDIDSNDFIQMTKALIRYHYSEWDYNRHFGGDEIYTLLAREDNIFLNKLNFKDSNIYAQLIYNMSWFAAYEDYEKGVSIFAGYGEEGQNPLLCSIKNDLDFSILEIERKLKEENYFNFENEMTDILKQYINTSKKYLKKGDSFFRARIGFQEKKRSIWGGFIGEIVYVPYSDSQIGAPPPHLAGFGRINRVGVSFLYCASDKYTSIAEVRPHPGEIVSIGKFLLNKDCVIFDLTETQFLNYYKSDKDLSLFREINTLIELLQKVIPPSQRHAYNITQLIADCITKLNCEGILFPSSVGQGDNLVLFNPKNMDYTFDEAEVVEIHDIKYEYSQKNWKKNVSEIEGFE